MDNNVRMGLSFVAAFFFIAGCLLIVNRTVEGSVSQECEMEKPFLMAVKDIFTIKRRGTVVTGRVERGLVRVNEVVEIVGLYQPAKLRSSG